MESDLESNILLIITNVRIYDVYPNHKGLRASGTLTFRLYPDLNLAGIEVGEYRCTLSKQLPVSQGANLVYLIADFDGFVGVALPETEKAGTLEALFDEYAQFTPLETRPPETFALRMADWLDQKSETLKWKLLDSSIEAGRSIRERGKSAEFTAVSRDEEKKVHPMIQSGTKGVKNATAFILSCSETVVDKAERASIFVGEKVSKLRKEPEELVIPQQASGAKVLASNTVKAFKKLALAAKESAVILTKSAHVATVKLVENKYGSQMSGVVESSLESLGELGQATLALGKLDFMNIATGVLNGTKRREDPVQ